ncbi:MAG: metallophosphoesterase [Fusobacteriaceae bacterium]
MFYFLFTMFMISSIVAAATTYITYSIYKSKKMFYVGAFFGYFPYVGAILARGLGRREIEGILGHFLFYYNYIALISIALIIMQLISLVFRKNLLDFFKKRKEIFSVVIIFLIGTLALYGKNNFDRIKGEKISISLKEKEEKKLKIGFISDTHLNRIFDGKKLDMALNQMENKGVEIVIIGGDFVDNDPSIIAPGIKEIIKKYNFPKGIYTVLGNHEYYGGIEKNIKYIEDVGIKILRDGILEIDGVNIVGRDDRTNRSRKSLTEILSEIDNKFPVIVVDHNPASLQESIENDIDFQLSGHTHNGQLIPMNHLVNRLNLNGYGYKKIEKTQSFVSSGLGTWMIPYRIGSQSQYVIIDLLY